jgi:hypothetical protein
MALLATQWKALAKLSSVSFAVSLLTGCLSTGVRSAGSELPQAATTFSDGQLRVTVEHNCKERCETVNVEFENLTTIPVEILVNQARLQRGAEKFMLKRQDEQKGNLKILPKKSASANFAPVSPSNGRRLSYVAPKAVWCSMKVSPECKNTTAADALCAGYARSYFDVYTEAGGWILLNFAYNVGGRTECIQSPAPETLGRGPDVSPKADDRAPAFFREPDSVVFYKKECNESCRCTDLTKPRRFSDDKLKPVVEPIP